MYFLRKKLFTKPEYNYKTWKFNIDFMKYKFQFCHLSPKWALDHFFPLQRGSSIMLNCLVSLFSFNLDCFSALIFHNIGIFFWRKQASYFIECASVWVCLLFLHDEMYWLYTGGQNSTELILCPSQGIGSRGTGDPSAPHYWW